MKKYQVTGTFVQVPAGVRLELTPNQAKTRGAKLQSKGNNLYITTGSVQFKMGESFCMQIDSIKNMPIKEVKKRGVR